MALTSCGTEAAVTGPSLVAERGSLGHAGLSAWAHRLSSHAMWTLSPLCVWDLPGPGGTSAHALRPPAKSLVLFLCHIFIEFVTMLLLFFTFWFFGSRKCGILAPKPGIKATPAALEDEVFTGQPVKSHQCTLIMNSWSSGDGWMASATQET